MSTTEGRPGITVLHALAKPDGKTRYVDHMIDSAPGELTVKTFSWPEAMFGRYDVFHIHWPENLIRTRTRWAVVPKRLLFVALMARLRLSRRAVVRTIHNVAPHESGGPVEDGLLRMCDGMTDGFVRLNRTTEAPEREYVATIPHGHYKDRPEYRRARTSPPAENRLLYFGLIRPYKGVDDLVDAFRTLDRPDTTLRVVGKPQDPDLARKVREAGERHESISCRLEFVPDSDLGREIAQARLVVLPYREMHNSGSAILALSMARPVVVPATPVNRELRDEVGPGWVYLYDSPALDAPTLQSVLEQVSADDAIRPAEPDLSGRDWSAVGEGHYAFYRSVLASVPAQDSSLR
jgi:beta-1,4-mannosyltransferase